MQKNITRIIFVTISLAIVGGIVGVHSYISNAYYVINDKENRQEDVVISTSTKTKISITPKNIRQGDPVLITLYGVASVREVKSLTMDNLPFFIFTHKDKVRAIKGIDLSATTGTFPIVLTLKDGRQLRENLIIKERKSDTKPFDIPSKLGGNTPESQRELFSTLALETKIINSIKTSKDKFWIEDFISPLKDPFVVADPYGYTRLVVNSTMPHKGADIKASMGTPVYAMNRGVVRFTGNLRNYGKTIVVDHGAGIQTVYMHLSTIDVVEDQVVERMSPLGVSGDTGYVLDPHLHLTVRIWEVSIDPVKFFELLK